MQAVLGTSVHLLLHGLVPGVVAQVLFQDRWKMAWLVMVATMVVDVDHLLANPIFDPDRCGIGFHPLHSGPAIVVYAVAVIVPVLRLPSVGLLIHMALDGIECLRVS